MKVLWVLYLVSGNAVQLSEYTKESDCVQAMEYADANTKKPNWSHTIKYVCVPVMLQTEMGEP